MTIDTKLPVANVQTVDFTVTRVTVCSDKSFEEVIGTLESIVGDGEYKVFEELVEAKAPFEHVRDVLESMLGNSGFMLFFLADMGALMSLMGKQKNAKLYLIGNPLIANQMIEHDTAVGLYVPPRVLVYDDYEGKTYITYDKPSSLMGQFQNKFISQVAQVLDQKFAQVAEAVT